MAFVTVYYMDSNTTDTADNYTMDYYYVYNGFVILIAMVICHQIYTHMIFDTVKQNKLFFIGFCGFLAIRKMKWVSSIAFQNPVSN